MRFKNFVSGGIEQCARRAGSGDWEIKFLKMRFLKEKQFVLIKHRARI